MSDKSIVDSAYQEFVGHTGARLLQTVSLNDQQFASITCNFSRPHEPAHIVDHIDSYSPETIVLTSTLSDGYYKANINIISRFENKRVTIEISDSWMRVYISSENKVAVSNLVSHIAGHPDISMRVTIPSVYID